MNTVIEKTADKLPETRRRIELLDFLRGTAMIYVMLYHLLYDVVEFLGADVPFWGSAWFEGVHLFFLVVLMSVSGVCTAFSRSSIKRGAALLLMGSALTMFTDIFLQGQVIVFGILTYFGVMMIIGGFLRPLLDKMNITAALIMVAVCIVLFIMLRDFPRGVVHFLGEHYIPMPQNTHYSYGIGIMPQNFYSADYFPLIPYGFIFLAGAAVAKPVKENMLPKAVYNFPKVPLLNFIGRHSLAFYIVHQPLFVAIVEIILLFKRS